MLANAGVLAAGSNAKALDGIADLLHNYASQRWPRNAHVQARAIRNGDIFHATGVTSWGRNAAMRLLGERLLDIPWLYAGGPLPVAADR